MCLFLRLRLRKDMHRGTPITELVKERRSGDSLVVLLLLETMLALDMQVVLVHWDLFSLQKGPGSN